MEIYAVNISKISYEKLYDLCLNNDPVEKSRIEKIVNKEDRVRSLIGRILIKINIAEKFKDRILDIRFNTTKYGKPYIVSYPDFYFSISHSGDYVLCAIDDKPIGVDVEKVKCFDYEKVVKRFFSEKEAEYVLKQDVVSRIYRFYEIWTLKESYIKCIGKGLAMSLNSFSIDVDLNKNIMVSYENEKKKHMFKIFDIGTEYKVAVCSLNKDISSNIIIMELNSLIQKYYKLCDT